MSIDKVRSLLQQALIELDAPGLPAVGIGADLVAVIAAAPPGAILTIDPAFGFIGDLTLTKPIALVSALGVGRVDNQLAGATIRGSVTITAPDVSLTGLRIEGVVKEQTLLTTGPGTIVDRCALIGSPAGQHRGVCVNSSGARITRSWIGNIWADIDTQAIAGWAGTANLTVDDCYLEASGENVIFGGADNASVAQNPHDIVLSNCTLTKPIAWKTQPGVTCKNLIEIKNAQHVTIRNCQCSNSWKSGQDGYGLVLTVRNQDGGSPWSTIADVVVSDCSFAHLGAGINILGSDDSHPSGRMAGVTIQRCQFTDIDPSTWGGAGRQVMIGRGPQQLTLNACTFDGKSLNSAITFAGSMAPPCDGLNITGCKFQEGDYGIIGDGAAALGAIALMDFAPGYTWAANAIVKGPSGRTITYPPGTTIVLP